MSAKPNLSPIQKRPHVLFVGAGSQGHAYAGPIKRLELATVVGVCEPILYKRQDFINRYIPDSATFKHLQFQTWKEFVAYEQARREKVKSGAITESDIEYHGVDAVFICVLDEFHVKAIKDLAPLGLHIMCEKPLATSLEDCISIRDIMRSAWKDLGRQTIFGIGHVLRYSPQNMLLRKLVRDDRIIGDIVSLEHTEPVGWWHMAHSFVR
jgi:predicted dehydrogenase